MILNVKARIGALVLVLLCGCMQAMQWSDWLWSEQENQHELLNSSQQAPKVSVSSAKPSSSTGSPQKQPSLIARFVTWLKWVPDSLERLANWFQRTFWDKKVASSASRPVIKIKKVEQPKEPELSAVPQTPEHSKVISGEQRLANWFDRQDAIYFYDKNDPYYEFTNFYAPQGGIQISSGGPHFDVWKTTEHYYQAQKFIQHSNIYNQINKAATARKAFEIARKNGLHIRKDWQQVNLDIMLRALRAKFYYNNGLRALLRETGDKVLVENAGNNDAFFGAGADGTGQNHLGRLLMHVRNELKTDQQTAYKP